MVSTGKRSNHILLTSIYIPRMDAQEDPSSIIGSLRLIGGNRIVLDVVANMYVAFHDLCEFNTATLPPERFNDRGLGLVHFPPHASHPGASKQIEKAIWSVIVDANIELLCDSFDTAFS